MTKPKPKKVVHFKDRFFRFWTNDIKQPHPRHIVMNMQFVRVTKHKEPREIWKLIWRQGKYANVYVKRCEGRRYPEVEHIFCTPVNSKTDRLPDYMRAKNIDTWSPNTNSG